MTKIFISHSSKDNEFAQQLARALTEVGIDVWLDLADIPASMKWSTAVQHGLDECDAMILIITPEAMASVNVEDEWQYYFDKKKKVFPVQWKPAEVHFQLRRIQYVDFHEKEFTGAFEKLRAELLRNGIVLTVDQGEMTEVRTDEATPPPRPAVASPPRIQGGAKTSLPRVEDILPPPFEWCEIPAGKVTLEAEGYLKEPTTFDVPAFAMAKYPITNAQFQVFVAERRGYNDASWWDYSEAAIDWRLDHPEPQDTGFAGDDLPRTNVSWYEAVAFCRWLSAMLDNALQVMLPTEQQWQRAAQGDDGWNYPWGNEFYQSKCNTFESDIRRTTPVTQYPQGASPYGMMDMSGNVWEWCLTAWDTGNNGFDGSNWRCLRGGSCVLNSGYARASCRFRSFPVSRDYGIGFRVCVSSPNS